jgi:hypothetical protein
MPKECYIKPDLRSEKLEPEALCWGWNWDWNWGCHGSPGGGTTTTYCGWCHHPHHRYRRCRHWGCYCHHDY